jgi:hypothetical protein
VADGGLQFEFHLGQVQQARRAPRLELDEEVDVAGLPEVRAQGRPVEREPADPMADCELVEEGVLDGQPFSQLHVVIMPHTPAPNPVRCDVLARWVSTPLWGDADDDVDVSRGLRSTSELDRQIDYRIARRAGLVPGSADVEGGARGSPCPNPLSRRSRSNYL